MYCIGGYGTDRVLREGVENCAEPRTRPALYQFVHVFLIHPLVLLLWLSTTIARRVAMPE